MCLINSACAISHQLKMASGLLLGLSSRCANRLYRLKGITNFGEGCQRRTISTSKKNKDTITLKDSELRQPKGPETAEEFADVKSQKNWITYGWDTHSKKSDRLQMHVSFFSVITMCIVGGTFVIMYYPDFKQRDWYAREGFLELHRREKLGLPLIDKNLIDPALIELPSDEELGDTEIII